MNNYGFLPTTLFSVNFDIKAKPTHRLIPAEMNTARDWKEKSQSEVNAHFIALTFFYSFFGAFCAELNASLRRYRIICICLFYYGFRFGSQHLSVRRFNNVEIHFDSDLEINKR